MSTINPSQVISTILKHDNKQTSYKIALLRNAGRDVTIPLHVPARVDSQ